jgi:hypothetical protein
MAEMSDFSKHILERWGFPTLVAIALGYFLRQDVILPLLESHRDTLKGITETQKEISQAIQEQTRLLYALQPRTAGSPIPTDDKN